VVQAAYSDTKSSASNNRSVPEVVESIITHNQLFHTSLKLRIVNYHALAKVIKSEVEKLIGKPTTVNTLVVAIKRLSDTISPGKTEQYPSSDILRDATITLTSDVADITIRSKESQFPNIMKRIVEISSRLDESPDLLKSSNLIKLIVNEKEYASLIRPELEIYDVEEMTGLSKLTLHLPRSEKKDSGFALFITELLYRQGINVVNSYIDEDTIILVRKEDAPRAYDVFQQEILRSEKEPAGAISEGSAIRPITMKSRESDHRKPQLILQLTQANHSLRQSGYEN
jgi:hypothetical protein